MGKNVMDLCDLIRQIIYFLCFVGCCQTGVGPSNSFEHDPHLPRLTSMTVKFAVWTRSLAPRSGDTTDHHIWQEELGGVADRHVRYRRSRNIGRDAAWNLVEAQATGID